MYGISSASATSISSSLTFGLRIAPRSITGPEPNGWVLIRFGSTPSVSVSCVTSTTIATSGRSPCASARAPLRPTSSCTATAATTSHAAPPASATSRAASSAM